MSSFFLVNGCCHFEFEILQNKKKSGTDLGKGRSNLEDLSLFFLWKKFIVKENSFS